MEHDLPAVLIVTALAALVVLLRFREPRSSWPPKTQATVIDVLARIAGANRDDVAKYLLTLERP